MATEINAPELWRAAVPNAQAHHNKYDRGHVLVVSGEKTGAARLAARGARRVGAGLVSVACLPGNEALIVADQPGVMTFDMQDGQVLPAMVHDHKISCALVGPGSGVGEATRRNVRMLRGQSLPCVVDADGLTSFTEEPHTLFQVLYEDCVLTPHEGEFESLFGQLEGNRSQRAAQAAAHSGAVVVLKGHDTVIAHPNGRVVINRAAPVWLASAGTGDVLAGLTVGLMAQKMPAFEAACAAVWLHSEAARQLGRGLIAEDLPETVPHIWPKKA